MISMSPSFTIADVAVFPDILGIAAAILDQATSERCFRSGARRNGGFPTSWKFDGRKDFIRAGYGMHRIQAAAPFRSAARARHADLIDRSALPMPQKHVRAPPDRGLALRGASGGPGLIAHVRHCNPTRFVDRRPSADASPTAAPCAGVFRETIRHVALYPSVALAPGRRNIVVAQRHNGWMRRLGARRSTGRRTATPWDSTRRSVGAGRVTRR